MQRRPTKVYVYTVIQPCNDTQNGSDPPELYSSNMFQWSKAKTEKTERQVWHPERSESPDYTKTINFVVHFYVENNRAGMPRKPSCKHLSFLSKPSQLLPEWSTHFSPILFCSARIRLSSCVFQWISRFQHLFRGGFYNRFKPQCTAQKYQIFLVSWPQNNHHLHKLTLSVLSQECMLCLIVWSARWDSNLAPSSKQMSCRVGTHSASPVFQACAWRGVPHVDANLRPRHQTS